MEAWVIALIISLSLIAFFALALLISYLTYRICFFSNRKRDNRAYLEKVLDRYGEKGEFFRKLVDNLRESESERIFIKSDDGLRLCARYYHKNDGAPLHILFHGYRSCAEFDMCGGAYECASLSHNVLLVDQRAHGESEGKSISFGINERRDLLLWCNYAKERFGDDVKIFIWGISMGGATVLMSLDLPLPANVVGAIADCPYSSPEAIIKKVGRNKHMPVCLLFPFLKLGARVFGGFCLGGASAEDSISKAKIPILLIHGVADSFVPCAMSEKIAERAALGGTDLRFLKFENASHGMSYLEDREKYRVAAYEFINEVLERSK